MTTTLKLDWPASRTSAVLRAIERPDTVLTDQQRTTVWTGLELYHDVPATLKLDWSERVIEALVRDLTTHLRSRPPDSDELTAAIEDIQGYRGAVAAVKTMRRHE